MKNSLKKIAVVAVLLLTNILIGSNPSHASKIIIQDKPENYNVEMNLGEIFNFFGDYFNEEIPESYKYIALNFKGIQQNSKVYESLQKLVYLNRIENKDTFINPNRKLSQYSFFKLSEKIFELNVNYLNIDNLKQQNTTYNEAEQIKQVIGQKSINLISNAKTKVKEKQNLFSDVYSTLLNEHYDKSNFNEIDILESAIEGLAKGTNDKHTVYFPPTESESFHDGLSGEYEGIGSYVEMEKPGLMKIISPISGSPSQKAGIKGGDIVLAVDTKEITKTISLAEAVSWIKGPAGTIVTLTIKRGEQVLDIDVVREKIIIKDVEYKALDRDTFYIEIKSFGEHVNDEFTNALEELKSKTQIKKVIIDLRNNGGGYLSEVADMLSYFVEEGEPTAVIKYTNNKKTLRSQGSSLIDFSKYNLVLLQNSGTASASEIMVGTIKDYYPDVYVIGEDSYGKGSVQTMKSYSDGSTIKYTIAKWFTGLSETGIDGVGIAPTIELEFDIENYKQNGSDNQLQKARSIQ